MMLLSVSGCCYCLSVDVVIVCQWRVLTLTSASFHSPGRPNDSSRSAPHSSFSWGRLLRPVWWFMFTASTSSAKTITPVLKQRLRRLRSATTVGNCRRENAQIDRNADRSPMACLRCGQTAKKMPKCYFLTNTHIIIMHFYFINIFVVFFSAIRYQNGLRKNTST